MSSLIEKRMTNKNTAKQTYNEFILRYCISKLSDNYDLGPFDSFA